MFPWLWIWSPQYQLPWSGDVAQDIDPTTSWFFGSIKPGAGNGRIEQKAFDVASYGKQLGLITEVLIDLAERGQPRSAPAEDAVVELKRIRDEIEAIKAAEYAEELQQLEARVALLKGKVQERAERIGRAPRGA